MNALYAHDLGIANLQGRLIGVDEAGRGALAGPVVVAAVALDYSHPIPDINDSKKLSPPPPGTAFRRNHLLRIGLVHR